MTLLYRLATLVALASLAAAPAAAHVTLDLATAPADSYVRAAIRVPHGCAGAATTAIRLQVPSSLRGVKPAPKPGWVLIVEPGEGSAVREVAWRGGPLPDSQFDEFLLMFHTPATPGEVLWFPFVQECEGGAVTRWIERPQEGQPRPSRPAWALRLLPKP